MRWSARAGGPAPSRERGAAGKPSRRLTGVDAARGLALIGLMSVHVLPSSDDETGEPTWSQILFSGDSAALFALLAGVGLALSTGGPRPHGGRELGADRVALVVRAVLIAVLGLAIGSLLADDLPADNILIYYGMFFLLAIPFLGLRIRHLLISAAAFTVLAPFLMQWAVDVLPAHVYGNPTLWNLVTDPVTVLSQLLLTGTYPALPYMAYLCAGIALGRMNLTSRRVQLWLVGAGAALALLSWTVSMGALLALGVYDRIWAATPWLTEAQIDEILVFGPDPSLPTSTLWWLMVPAPHSNTPVALLLSLGMAAFALGAFLLLARLIGKALTPLAAAGSMTFTLYTLHLLFLGTGVYDLHPGFWFWMQVAVFGLLAVAWQRAVGQGPLEKLVARTSKRIAGSVAAR